MLFLVATNIVASRPPERRPTGTPHARAKRVHGMFCQLYQKRTGHSKVYQQFLPKCEEYAARFVTN